MHCPARMSLSRVTYSDKSALFLAVLSRKAGSQHLLVCLWIAMNLAGAWSVKVFDLLFITDYYFYFFAFILILKKGCIRILFILTPECFSATFTPCSSRRG